MSLQMKQASVSHKPVMCDSMIERLFHHVASKLHLKAGQDLTQILSLPVFVYSTFKCSDFERQSVLSSFGVRVSAVVKGIYILYISSHSVSVVNVSYDKESTNTRSHTYIHSSTPCTHVPHTQHSHMLIHKSDSRM